MLKAYFPSRTITIYMAQMFLARTFAILFLLVLVLQTLDLLGETGSILSHPGNGSAEIWRYLSLRTPQLIARFLPFSVLLGTLVTLGTLNQNSEIVSMKASGLSAHQVLAPLFVASLFVAVISFAFNDQIVSRSTATLDRWRDIGYAPIPIPKNSQGNVWVHDGNNLIHAGEVVGKGANTKLTNVTIYGRVAGGLETIVRSPSAIPMGKGWQLVDAQQFDVASGKSVPLGTIIAGSGIKPDQFTLATVHADDLPFLELRRAIVELKQAGRSTGPVESGMWHKISGPLSALLMPLLGAVAGFGIARSGRLFVRISIGMALGFTYFVADNFGLAMGDLGAYSPLLAAWGPFFLFLFIGEAVLIHTEE